MVREPSRTIELQPYRHMEKTPSFDRPSSPLTPSLCASSTASVFDQLVNDHHDGSPDPLFSWHVEDLEDANGNFPGA